MTHIYMKKNESLTGFLNNPSNKLRHQKFIYTTKCYASTAYAVAVCTYVRLSKMVESRITQTSFPMIKILAKS